MLMPLGFAPVATPPVLDAATELVALIAGDSSAALLTKIAVVE